MEDKFERESEEQLNIEFMAFEKSLEERQAALEKQREEYYKEKSERLGTSFEELKRKRKKASHDSDVVVYKAKAAAREFRYKKVEESFLHRTIRLVKALAEAKKKIRSYEYITNEKKKKIIRDVFCDAWKPVTDFLFKIPDDLWEFVCALWGDFVEIVFFFVNIFITIGYYVGSFALYIWDVIWDLRIWLDGKKRTVFNYFAGAVAATAVVLIFISSLTAYEYSYYGRTLGVTRTKQEVYQTIDALGDKLSAASGANVNLNVERDIEFKKVFGFNIEVDSAEDILNTLTYMKDIQVRAFAINVGEKQAVIVESEEIANKILARIREDFAGEKEGVEYIQVSYDEPVTVEEVGVLLGDIWNPFDALKYLKTGSARDLAEGEKENPVVTLRSTEIATYNQNVKFGAKYIDNSEIYDGETELISAGIYGTNKVVAEVSRINGVEQKRTIMSTTRTKNPVDAVYYMGTKPIPEKKGTGTFIWPIKNVQKRMLTSYFGSRNTGIVGATTNHQGLDIGVSTGTKIYACDGGTVTFAGWQAGYGYLVIIDHGGLYETRYGHCSKILVKVGEDVYQGQNIALVGSTGVSSGPHCHLEIRYNEVAKNPLTLLPSL